MELRSPSPQEWPGLRMARIWGARYESGKLLQRRGAAAQHWADSTYTEIQDRPQSWYAGPMARNVEDVALMLDAMSGEHPGDPLSLPKRAKSFLSTARSGNNPKRVAYSPDFVIKPVDPHVAAITRMAAARLQKWAQS